MGSGSGRRHSLLTKFHLTLVLAVLPLVLLQQLYVVPAMRAQLHEDRVHAVRDLVEVGYGVLQAYEARTRTGELSVPEARRQATALLEGLRYAHSEYFWINDLDTRLVMHPFLPQSIGQDMTGYEDRAGKRVFVDIVALARERGEGAVEYLATRPHEQQPIPKVSYVKLFAPWGWVLGTGVYEEDVELEVARLQRRLWGVLVLGVAAAVLTGQSMARRVLRPLGSLAQAAGQVARGNLRVAVAVPSRDEVGELSQAFNAMVVDVQRMLREMGEVSRTTETDAEHIHRAADGLRLASQTQSRALQGMTSAVTAMTQELAVGAHHAQLTARNAEFNEQVAREGGAAVGATGQKMKEIARGVERSVRVVDRLTQWSEEVERAVELISDVADQTRVLAVNTSIEAMRAGDHGRGFAVVAQEVRKLAEQARSAAEHIHRLMRESQKETQAAAQHMREGRALVLEGLELSEQTGKALERIVAGAEEIQRRVRDTALAHAEQAEQGESLTLRLHALSSRADAAAADVEEITLAVEGLKAGARQLRERVMHFQLEGPSSPPAPSPESAPPRG